MDMNPQPSLDENAKGPTLNVIATCEVTRRVVQTKEPSGVRCSASSMCHRTKFFQGIGLPFGCFFECTLVGVGLKEKPRHISVQDED